MAVTAQIPVDSETGDLGREDAEIGLAGNRTESNPRAARKLTVLLVEDSTADSELITRALANADWEVHCEVVDTEEDFTNAIRGKSFDIVLADYRLPGWNGMGTLRILRQEGMDIPVLLVSGALGEEKAVECMRHGAADFILKDRLGRLSDAIARALEEQRLRDENRRVLQDLARSNRDLEQFAYVASHDLQEPLRMVATYTQLLAEKYQGKLDENADKYIHYAVDGALRMQTLVKDLLAFSRVGRDGRSARPIDCDSIVRSVMANLRSSIQESGARIDYEGLPTVMADPSELIQVFQNLIANAIKFVNAKPPVVRITAQRRKDEWEFSVADNGIGIAPEFAEEVFVIFKRLHTRAEYAGNGIGLSICKKIAEQNGGRIWVDSKRGGGTTFRFTWPVKSKRGAYEYSTDNQEASSARG